MLRVRFIDPALRNDHAQHITSAIRRFVCHLFPYSAAYPLRVYAPRSWPDAVAAMYNTNTAIEWPTRRQLQMLRCWDSAIVMHLWIKQTQLSIFVLVFSLLHWLQYVGFRRTVRVFNRIHNFQSRRAAEYPQMISHRNPGRSSCLGNQPEGIREGCRIKSTSKRNR
jgi:hypothetical protein